MSKNEFRIVKILDEYNVIINGGENNGLTEGSELQILDTKGSQVIDPDTNEVIGELDLIKAVIEVTHLYEKMSVCSPKKETISINPLAGSIGMIQSAALSSLALSETKREKLNVDYKDITGGTTKSNEKIRIGDKVRLIR